MIFNLRDSSGNDIIDLEIFNKLNNSNSTVTDLRVYVDLKSYSNHLLSLESTQYTFIAEIDTLSNLREWLWNYFFKDGGNDGSRLDEVTDYIREILIKISDYYNLIFVED